MNKLLTNRLRSKNCCLKIKTKISNAHTNKPNKFSYHYFFLTIYIQLSVSLILQHFGLYGTALRPEQPTAQAANEAVEVIQL